jgi:hypothetical protein
MLWVTACRPSGSDRRVVCSRKLTALHLHSRPPEGGGAAQRNLNDFKGAENPAPCRFRPENRYCGLTTSPTTFYFNRSRWRKGEGFFIGAVFHVDGLLAQGLRVAAMRAFRPKVTAAG